MTAEQRKFINAQLAVSAVLNAALSALFVWIVFRGLVAIGLWGATGLAFDLIPTTFMITLMTGIALTLVTRAAVRRGQVQPLDGTSRVPRSVLLRSLAFAIGATLVLVPLTTALLWAIWGSDWSYRTVLIFKIIYGVALGFAVTPIVIRTALRDFARSATPA